MLPQKVIESASPYCEAQIKSRGFSSRKQNEGNLKQQPN